jgi:hypothetical protein
VLARELPQLGDRHHEVVHRIVFRGQRHRALQLGVGLARLRLGRGQVPEHAGQGSVHRRLVHREQRGKPRAGGLET